MAPPIVAPNPEVIGPPKAPIAAPILPPAAAPVAPPVKTSPHFSLKSYIFFLLKLKTLMAT